MGHFFAKMVLALLAVGCALFLLYYVCQKWEEHRNYRLAREDDLEMGRWESRDAGFDSGDNDRREITAAVRDNENAAAGGAQEGEGSGDIGLARTLTLEG